MGSHYLGTCLGVGAFYSNSQSSYIGAYPGVGTCPEHLYTYQRVSGLYKQGMHGPSHAAAYILKTPRNLRAGKLVKFLMFIT